MIQLSATTSVSAQVPSSDPSKPDNEAVVLDKLEVKETAADTLAPVSLQNATMALANVAGGTRLIDNTEVNRGRVGTSADVLAFTPGVFATPPSGGGDGIKISARGSGIARSAGNFFRNGVLFSFDGLPVTGAGGTPYELFETYGLNYTEVLLGGNAFEFGALQLGGSVNYVTKTGYDASPLEARLEAGSFGYRKYQLSSGQVVGAADYFVSVTSAESDGYQPNARSSSEGFAGNFGYRFTEALNTRFYLRYRTTENENPGNLTLNQLRDSTKQANPTNVTSRSNRVQPGSTWLANKTDVEITPDSHLELGLVHHNAPIDIQPNPSPANLYRSLWNFRDVTAQAKYVRHGTLFDRYSESTVAAVVSYEYDAGVNIFSNNPNVTTGDDAFGRLRKTANYDGSSDSSLRFANKLDLRDDLALNTGLTLVHIRRASEVTFASGTGVTPANYTSLDRENTYLAPRVGFLYDVTPDVSVYANLTRSVEAPNSWQLNRGSNPTFLGHDDIQDQKAWAAELGTRAQAGIFEGSVSIYRTNLEDEILTVPIDPNNSTLGTRTFNGPDTYKQGVELGLRTTLWSEHGGFFSAAPAQEKSSRLTFLQTFNYNDFGYRGNNVFPAGDPNSGADELPGVPRNQYQGRLSFEHSSGFYVNVTANRASSYYVDFANTLEAPGYTVYDFGVGYESPSGHWSVFADLRNLTDKAYAASAGPAYTTGATAAARANSAQFQAADGRALYAGLTLRF